MTRLHDLKTIYFQILAQPEGDSITLEFLTDAGDVFISISLEDGGERVATIFETEERIKVPLSELRRGIEIAEARVIKLGLDGLFDDE